ncbi:MAG: AAA family ATPase [Sulfurovaceae bacterium]|nr:AAA family ATPase [Sulfurovaceae bacterium]
MNSDIIDLETSKSRLSGKKREMKEAIEKILNDLQSLLDGLGGSLSPLLERYKEGWGLAFDLPKEVNTFRDLMIAEVDFYIKDKSNSKAIDAKGSGLQRLCHILMHFRIIEKLNAKKESVILAIDEPDVYLHSGLQKKLLEDINKYIDKNQIFVTTHSPIFIDTVKLSNVFYWIKKLKKIKNLHEEKCTPPHKLDHI